jgi:hypothetical protein
MQDIRTGVKPQVFKITDGNPRRPLHLSFLLAHIIFGFFCTLLGARRAGWSGGKSTICGPERVKDQSNVQAALYEWAMKSI